MRNSWLVALLLLMPLAPGDAEAAACTPDEVWFLGVVYDAAVRDDFEKDVENFEFFLDRLQNVYCIPSSQSKILAFENGYTQNGNTYDEASERNVKDWLATFGADASAASNPTFFVFLSSHGLVYPVPLATATVPCGVTEPRVGSFAALKSGGGEDGDLYDCELGAALDSGFADVRTFVAVDCSFCGGFSDSLTAASGTVEDNSHPSSNVPGPERIVVTGCAMTTECFGSSGGGVLYRHMRDTLASPSFCDGWTAPGFPTVQGFDAPVKHAVLNPVDGECTASEWFFGAVWRAYASADVVGIQEQFRIKYGPATLADDIRVG